MCTIAAPALAASRQELAICSGVTGTAGFLPGVSAEPVTAQEIITLRAMPSSIGAGRSTALAKGARLRGMRQAPQQTVHGRRVKKEGVSAEKLFVQRNADDA